MQPVKTKKKLSRADRKQIEAAIARANRTDKKEKSAQDSIPYERMWPDGICRVSDGHYTKTIQFQDINYQLSQNEDKTAIFEGWCDFLNYFDSSIQFELSFLNLAASEETFARAINIPLQGDDFDSIRIEYMTMLQNQLAKGNNGLIKTKYLTFGIDADSIKAAKPRLERIETDILNNFKRLGVAAETLDGKARLAQLHGIFHMDEQLPFRFEWDWLPSSGLSTKDFIAPSSFEFRTGKQFRMGKKYGAVSFVQILAPELNDRMLADFLDMESNLIVSLHIQSVDQIKAIKTVKRKITDLDKSKIEEQKKAVRAGYDIDIIPSDLATYGVEAKKLLQDLQSRNERMFLVTFLVLNTADNPRQLDNNVFQASSIAQKYNCRLTRLDFQQEEGLMSCLPLGLNQIEIQRGLTTSSTAISSVASELLTPEQLEMYQVYRQTLGNKPLIFGGGSTNTSDSESLEGVEFVNGTRPGNPELVELAKRQVGNVGGQPYWSWYGFNSRVEWCACFVSWCYGQMGLSEPRFAGCQSQGVPWFQSHGQWGARGYDNLAPGDAIFFDWDLDGSADHVGIVIGTDGSRVYTVEGNSGDACKIRSYDVNYECIKGYGLMNW